MFALTDQCISIHSLASVWTCKATFSIGKLTTPWFSGEQHRPSVQARIKVFENADTAKMKTRELYCKVQMSPIQVAVKQYSWTVEEDRVQKPIPLVKNRSLD